jgi:hypothetical protein
MSEVAIYTQHEDKLAMLEKRRTKPFDESVIRAVENVDGLLDVLTGDMILPDEIEGRIWLTIAGEIMEAKGAGIEIEGVKWSLLDILLAVATKTDEFPVLLLVEVMLAEDSIVVRLRGRPVHAGQLYNATYEGWSTMEDIKDRARHHFKFGYLLITINEVGRAVDQLLLAKACDPSSASDDLLRKLVEAEKGPITSSTGRVVSIASNGKLVVEGEPVTVVQPPASAAAEDTHTSPTSHTSHAPSASAPAKQVPVDADDKGSSSGFGVAVAVAVVAVIGLGLLGLALGRRKRQL